MILRIDYYLIMSYVLGTLKRVIKILGKVVETSKTTRGVQHTPEVQSNTISSQFRPPGPIYIKTDLTDSFGLRFR